MLRFPFKAFKFIADKASTKLFPEEPGGHEGLKGRNHLPPKKEPWGTKVKNFCFHPTVWRLLMLGIAITTTVITAGAIIPVVTLASTAFTALISVIGKTIQHRSLERAKLQNGLIKVIEKREEDMQKLRKGHGRVFDVLEKDGRPFAKAKELHDVKNIKPEHRGWSIARVLGFIGLEQFWTVSLFATAANPVGIAVYASGLAVGTLVVKSEYDYRVKEEQERSRLKEETNARCKILGIAKYANDKELYQQFETRMINYKAIELLCKEDTSKLSDEAILEKFDEKRREAKSKLTFTNIPQKVSFGRNFLNAVNPFKDENAVRCFDIDFDEEKCHFEMKGGYEVIKDKSVKGQFLGKDHTVVKIGNDERLAAAKQGLKEAKVDQRKEGQQEVDIEAAKQKLQAAKAEGERLVSSPATIEEAQANVKGAVEKGFVEEEQDRREMGESKTKKHGLSG